MKLIIGGITAPKGFLASATNCGIKKSGRDDLALLYSKVHSVSAGTFTTNRFKSGSVVLTEKRIKKGIAQAIIVNSGNANCCVGKKEIKDAESITGLVAKKLKLNKNNILIASTGIIGRALPTGKIKRKVAHLVDNLGRNGLGFAKAIKTTDTVHKEIAVKIKLGSKKVVIAGATKGSGMICPNMATMLAFFTTDAFIGKDALKSAFKDAVSDSFNRITVDGDMSTNDSAIIFANGLAGNKCIKKNTPDYFKFLNALKFVAKELAKRIVLDGEGATKFVEVLVKNAKSVNDAEKIARRIADSSLVKTMIAGGDPNWGRVAASIGASGVGVKKDSVDIYFDKTLAMRNGKGASIARKVLSGIFKKKGIDIAVDLNSGNKSAKVWTCDLTEKYVRINAKYEA